MPDMRIKIFQVILVIKGFTYRSVIVNQLNEMI